MDKLEEIKQFCINEIEEFSWDDDRFTSERDYEIFQGREEFARVILNKIMEETNEQL
tara:strand:+ start:382 stop:552 length:171 start_codon:yes stop_codon:yes gene_type:complete